MRERHNPGTDSLALIPLCKMSNLVTLYGMRLIPTCKAQRDL